MLAIFNTVFYSSCQLDRIFSVRMQLLKFWKNAIQKKKEEKIVL